jgi:hypothetical protein
MCDVTVFQNGTHGSNGTHVKDCVLKIGSTQLHFLENFVTRQPKS